MLGKGFKLYSILRMKCPQCHEGSFFKGQHPYQFNTMGVLHKNCKKCNVKFELETGFYQGSYYISYGLGVALFIAVWLLIMLFKENYSPGLLLFSFLGALLLLFPLLYALSKIIWANLFFRYKKPNQSINIVNSQDDSRIKK